MRHRDRLARQSVHIPDEPALVMGTRNALALARANMGHNGISTPPPAIQVTEQNENRPYTDNPQTTEQDQYGSTHGEAYPDYYNTAVQPEVAHVQFQHPYAYDANGPPIVSRELTTNPPQMQHQYADLSHALSSPPPVHAANTGSPFSDPVESTYAPKRSNSGGQNGNTQDRFFMAQYAQPTRTGTPVDPNPQQYFTPGQGHNGGNMHAA
ncbi:uncharacterized protein EI90DRAFT_1684433 [Cantharellus anzutake]|uniref:uncharacterized protein n=1 Tax=Cantharellus anzutake TaxID=1750568 RepID=UPI001907FC38|nr:uncharacterized protein EI90DRAFT_1684433 [Cantharellus anzutake]KAF8327800.1 hypothetical protein EI90DRAFT_1684433 [Cantharellus anzutake]